MPGSPLPIQPILTLLAAGPTRITASTAGLSEAQLQAAPGPGQWSANEVLAHLRACADVWGDCIAAILDQPAPVIRAVNPRTWIESTDYLRQPFQASLQAFTRQRAELLALLQSLQLEAWSRSATVTGAGRPLERSVQFYAQWMATHERAHVKQIQRIASRI